MRRNFTNKKTTLNFSGKTDADGYQCNISCPFRTQFQPICFPQEAFVMQNLENHRLLWFSHLALIISSRYTGRVKVIILT
jgi:hypothetical protein